MMTKVGDTTENNESVEPSGKASRRPTSLKQVLINKGLTAEEAAEAEVVLHELIGPTGPKKHISTKVTFILHCI